MATHRFIPAVLPFKTVYIFCMKIKDLFRFRWAKHQRRWFGKWHVYLGIIAGFIIAIISVTGSILIFQDNIDLALNKDFFEVQATQHKIPIEEIVPIVKQKYPNLRFDYAMNENDQPNLAYRFYNFGTEEEFFINPYTGSLSGKRLYESSFIRIVMDIHTSLLIPTIGTYITGIAALILLILTISGLRLWIPKKWRQLKSMLTVDLKRGFKRKNYDWHNVIGFYTAPVVVFLALTGFCIAFATVIVPSLFILSGKSPQGVAEIFDTKSVYQKNVAPLSPKAIAALAYVQMPHSRIGGIALPADSSGTYRLDMISPELPKTGKREMLVFDQYNGHILLNSRKDFPNVGNAYLSWLVPLHYGSFGGLPTQIIALIGGLAPLLLFITGFIIWYPRWRKQKKNAATKNASENKPKQPFFLRAKGAVAKQHSVFQYFFYQLEAGFRYAAWMLLIIGVMGILYGMFSGIIWQPAVFGIAFTTVLILINFIIASAGLLFNIVFLATFKKGKRILVKYFSISLGFCITFLIAYFLLLNTGINIF